MNSNFEQQNQILILGQNAWPGLTVRCVMTVHKILPYLSRPYVVEQLKLEIKKVYMVPLLRVWVKFKFFLGNFKIGEIHSEKLA